MAESTKKDNINTYLNRELRSNTPLVTTKVEGLTLPKNYNDTQKQIAYNIYNTAKSLGDKYPQLTLAQAMLESGHFKKPSGKNNYFGIKGTQGSVLTTTEFIDGKEVPTVATFRDFNTLEEGLKYRVENWSPKYAEAKTVEDALYSIWKYNPEKQRGEGYATAPNYDRTIFSMLNSMGNPITTQVEERVFKTNIEVPNFIAQNKNIAPDSEGLKRIEELLRLDRAHTEANANKSKDLANAENSLLQKQNRRNQIETLLTNFNLEYTPAKYDGSVQTFEDGGAFIDNPELSRIAKVLNFRNQNLEWVNRGMNPESSPKIVNPDGSESTHELSYVTGDSGEAYVFPTVVNNQGSLERLTTEEALQYAEENNSMLRVPSVKVADYYTKEGLVKHDGNYQQSPENIKQEIQREKLYETNPLDFLSFSEAFKQSRVEKGKDGTFIWKGKTYGLKYPSELPNNQTKVQNIEQEATQTLPETELTFEDYLKQSTGVSLSNLTLPPNFKEEEPIQKNYRSLESLGQNPYNSNLINSQIETPNFKEEEPIQKNYRSLESLGQNPYNSNLINSQIETPNFKEEEPLPDNKQLASFVKEQESELARYNKAFAEFDLGDSVFEVFNHPDKLIKTYSKLEAENKTEELDKLITTVTEGFGYLNLLPKLAVEAALKYQKIRPDVDNALLTAEYLIENPEEIVGMIQRRAMQMGLYSVEEAKVKIPKKEKKIETPKSYLNDKFLDEKVNTTPFKPDPNIFFKKEGEVLEAVSKNTNISIHKNQFYADSGFDYIPIGTKLRGAKEYEGVEAVAHNFIMDKRPGIDPAKRGNFKDVYELVRDNDNEGLKQQSDWYIKGENFTKLPENHYVPIFKIKEGGKLNVTYKTKKDVKEEDAVITKLVQYKYKDIDWDSKTPYVFINTSALKTKNKAPIPQLVFSNTGGKDSYSKTTGAAPVVIFKDNKGKLIARDLAGSINYVKNEVENIAKEYNIDVNNITLAFYDTGAYVSKPAAKDGKLKKSQWSDYHTSLASGSGIAIPKQN